MNRIFSKDLKKYLRNNFDLNAFNISRLEKFDECGIRCFNENIWRYEINTFYLSFYLSDYKGEVLE